MKRLLFVTLLSHTVTAICYAQPAGYSYGKQIVIQASQVSGSSDLTDFPVLISLTDNDLRTTANGGRVESALGHDIVFDAGCATPLDHQVERYNGATGEYVAWVRIPSLSATSNTAIYIYYGNASAGDTSTDNVWDAGYVGVWHLNNNDFSDASGTGNDGANGGSANVAAARIAGGRSFTPANNYVQLPSGSWTVASGTISFWGYVNAFSGNHQYFFGHTTDPAYSNRIQIFTDDAGGNLDVGMGGAHYASTGIATLATGTWYYITLTWDSGNFSVYVNNNAPVNGTYTNLTALRAFGDIGNQGNPAARNEAQNGQMDEVRVSTIARSADWIATEYNNQNTPSSFYTVSAEMSAGAACALPVELSAFEAKVAGHRVKLTWTTETEHNNDHFTIERSDDGAGWEDITTEKGAGKSNQRRHYVAWDDNPHSGRSYYRLRQTDYDGTYAHSAIQAVTYETERTFIVYPHPADGEFTVGTGADGPVTLQLFNALGQAVHIPSVTTGGRIVVNTAGLRNGVYHLQVTGSRQVRQVRVVVRH